MMTEHVDYVARAQSIAPQIAAAGDEIERERRLPPAIVRAMTEAGLFRMLLPRSIGGGETTPAELLRVLEVVAQADGSTGWCLAQGAISAAQVAPYLAHETAVEVFGDPGIVLSNGPGPAGKAVAVEGGYRLTGEWGFASGCTHATWFKAHAIVFQPDGAPVLREDGSRVNKSLVFPAAEGEIRDTWHVSGLRGTGSNTIVARDVFVPEARAVSLGFVSKVETGPLYTVPYISLACAGFSAVAMGIARGALDAFITLARDKAPRATRTVLRENAVIQSQVARAEAELRSARAFLYQAYDDLWQASQHGEPPPLEPRVLVRLAATSGIHAAARVVDVAYHAAGATAIFESNPFERRFRDVHAVTQQVQATQAHFETVGQFFLGLDPARDYF